MNIEAALQYGRRLLNKAHVQSAQIDAVVLLCHALNISKEAAYARMEYILTGDEQKKYNKCINMRLEHKPVQYIINVAHFMGLTFYVDDNVLIPRCDTEILAELVINCAKHINAPRILDLCCGSGAVGVSCAYYLKNAFVTCADISEKAVSIAEKNAKSTSVYNRMSFVVSDLFDNISGKYDIIASNPPYIKSGEMSALRPQVKLYEPVLALDGGKSGLNFYEKISKTAAHYLNNNGKLMFEIGAAQAHDVFGILNANKFAGISVNKDLAGHDRVVSAAYLEGKNAGEVN